MEKSRNELSAMLKNDLINIAEKEGIEVKPYWTKEKIIESILDQSKSYKDKKEGIAKDFKKRWMELSKVSIHPTVGQKISPGDTIALQDKDTGLVDSDSKLTKLGKPQKLQAIMAKEIIDNEKLKAMKKKKLETKLRQELNLATAELDKDMMESFKKKHIDISDFEKTQRISTPSNINKFRTDKFGPKLGKKPRETSSVEKVKLSKLGFGKQSGHIDGGTHRGLVNGLGMINGNGLTNGKGLINGLMSNGLINGNGLVNGTTHGLVNGQGQGFINGKGLISHVRRGSTNGFNTKGSIYRKALINGNGLTNGNGITNGSGLTLQFLKGAGTGQGKLIRRLARINIIQSRLRKERLAILIVIIALIIAPVLFFMTDIPMREDMKIDGKFHDWMTVTTYKDNEFDQLRNQNINIIEYTAIENDDYLLLYLKTHDDIFNGFSSEVAYAFEVLNIFIDIDNNPETGYNLSDLGSDYRLELSGVNGELKTKSVYKYETVDNNLNWNQWKYLRSFDAKNQDTELEAKIKFENNGYTDLNDAKLIFVFKDFQDNIDRSDLIISPSKPAVFIEETVIAPSTVPYNQTNVPFLKLSLQTQGAEEAVLKSLEFIILGSFNNSRFGSLNFTLCIDQDKTQMYSCDEDKILLGIPIVDFNNKSIKYNFENELTIRAGETVDVLLTIDITDQLSPFSTIGFKLNPAMENPDAIITILSTQPIGCYSPSTYVYGVPDTIIVDGAFGDWEPVNEYIDSDEKVIKNPDVDINSYKIYQENERISFFFQVKGELFGGTAVTITPGLITKHVEKIDSDDDGVPDEIDPNPNFKYDTDGDNWSDDYEDIISKTNKTNRDTDNDSYIDSQDIAPLDPTVPPIKKETLMMDGNDTALIFIDSDQNKFSGYTKPGLEIGAEYMIRVRGKYGYIINSSLFRFDSTDRYDSKGFIFMKEINIGTDAQRLETQVNLVELNITSKRGVDVIFIIHDWDLSSMDDSDSVLSSDIGLKPTPQQILVLNQISYPLDFWYVNFQTTGTGTITIGNHSFPNFIDFKGLYYLNPSEKIYYRVPVRFDIINRTVKADWRFNLGLVVFESRTEGEHLIEIIFGNREYAIMNPSNESRADLIRMINSGETTRYDSLLNGGGDFYNINPSGSRGLTPTVETKTLYLLDSGTNKIMNTSVGNGQSSHYTRVYNNGVTSWLQTPNLAGEFSLDGDIIINLYLGPKEATGPNNQGLPDLRVSLKYGSTVIGSETKTNLSAAGWYIFTFSPQMTSLPENAAIRLETSVLNAGAGKSGNPGYVDIFYNSVSRNSRVNLKTDTYIDVEWIKLYNQTGNETYVFEPGDVMTIRANITDPLGLYDIKYVNATMLMSDNTVNPNLNDVRMTGIYSQDTAAPYFWRIYEYDYTVPDDFPNGWYTLWINATESNLVKYGTWIYFINPPVLGVSIFPDTTEFVDAGTTVDYYFTVKNIGNSTDTYDISIDSSSQNWRSELYFNNTLVAYDSNGDGSWDWIYMNYDSTSDGNPDIELEPLEEYEILIKKAIPSAVGSKTDITVIKASSAYNSSLFDTTKAKSVVSPSKKIKNVYLHQNLPKNLMNTFIGSQSATTYTQIKNDKSVTWELSPVFAGDFKIVGDIEVYLYIDPTAGTGWNTEGNPDVEVILKYGSTTIGTEKIENIEAAQWYTFHVVPGVTTIPEGNAITLTVAVDNAKRGRFGDDGYIDLYYDSSTYDSRIDLPTDTYIRVNSVNTYNSTTGLGQILFIKGDRVEIRANVTDPFGIHDTSAKVYITSPGGTYGDVVNGVSMGTFTQDPTAPYFWVIYNHSYQLAKNALKGTYQVNIVAKETNGVIWNASTTFVVSGANVTIIPDHYQVVYPATNVTYAHTIKNNAIFADRVDITYTSSQGWNVTLYKDSNNNGILDAGDQMMAYDYTGDDTWDWVSSSYDTDNDGLPDTGLLGSKQTFKIIIKVEIPANPGMVTEVTKIIATSNYNTSISDEAVDTSKIIPEFSVIIIPISVMLLIGIIVNHFSKKYPNKKNDEI